jgi:osmotically-inducible protein OsmY
MNVKTRTTAKTTSGAAKGGASAIRTWVESRGPNVDDARKNANRALSDAQKQARSTVKDARKQARRQLVQARIAAARARSGSRAKAAGVSAKAVGAAGAVGLAAGYFLDPDSGRRRRHEARDRARAVIRRSADRTRGEAEYRAGQVEGKVEAAKSQASPGKPAANDQALAERVKSEIFRPADTPKESVNVNVENGVVYLRGEVKQPDQIRKLVEQAGEVDGVAAVESLLHTP